MELIVKKQLTYHVIPFIYNKDYVTLVNNIKNSELSVWQYKARKNHHLHEHVDDLISEDFNCLETIGTRFILKNEKRALFRLPKNHTGKLALKTKGLGDLPFFIKDIEIYLFETQLGFLIFELTFPDNCTIDHVLNVNYHFKKIAQGIIIEYDLAIKDEELSKDTSVPQYHIKREQIYLFDIVRSLLNDFCVASYFDSIYKTQKDHNSTNSDVSGDIDSKHIVPDHALVFSSVLIDKKPDDKILGEYLFWMRRCFKESYKPSPNELLVNSNEEIEQMFENSFWGVSQEGMTNLSFLTDDETTNTFFESGFYEAIKTTYFYIYIIALHQRYSLLNFSRLASLIPKRLDRLTKIKGNELKERIISFTLRAYFVSVSGVTHQNNLYKKIVDALSIKELMNDLNFSIEGITSLVKLREDETRDKFLSYVTVIATLLAVIQASSSLKDLLWDKYPLKTVLLICIAFIIGTISIVWLVYKLYRIHNENIK